MFRALKSRIRQLWMQCDLFETLLPERGDGGRGTDEQRLGGEPKRRTRRRRVSPKGSAVLTTTQPRSEGRRARVARSHPQDVKFVERLTAAYLQYNVDLFGNELTPVAIRISRRMKNRLGHYMAASKGGVPAEIAISRRHIRRDTWDEVLHTLVHEMVHQWQDQKGLPIDHGRHFRAKAREVGISARATRRVTEYLSPHAIITD